MLLAIDVARAGANKKIPALLCSNNLVRHQRNLREMGIQIHNPSPWSSSSLLLGRNMTAMSMERCNFGCIHAQPPLAHVKMDSDRIQMKSDPNVTFYHILIRIRMRMRIFSNTNTKQIVQIWIRIQIPF